ncbi:hypothetical protein I3842_14G099800 [Carya illinoinensis]|uniref:Disease resistance RPP13-like protein 1 n=2 Tax=Carya illinoinensis TaxID=32201 RepID=A0A922D9B5_CARIL|nr:hypothetical protein I3842_14G099800 [Carya illinoinensis]KAG6678806.1 hypothetical protein I3842_14G099800 [Carya illinoinensis]
MAELGVAVLSPFLQILFDKMTSGEFVDFLRGRKLNDGLLNKLKTILLSVEVMLEDAENKQVMNPSVKKWLDELKHAVYDAEDVLDEFATKAIQSRLDAEFGTTTSKVRNSISTSLFFNKIEVSIKEVLERLENLASQHIVMGLTQGTVRGKPYERLPTTSLVEETEIYGRNNDKEQIINQLLSITDDASDNKVGVIAIVGMGGMGKTTLAQVVYNDKDVREHFNLTTWVCVSEEFDPFRVTKTILDAVTSSTSNIEDLNQLQLQLKEKLNGKKFLFVLDDVWNKNYNDWEILSSPFKFGAQGSRIIVTTRDDEVASVMRAFATHPVKKLPEQDCWSLFARHAFHDANSSAHLELQELGQKIVKKCQGLPLAIKAIGGLLRFKVDVREWEKVLCSELWELSSHETNNILPALRLSYRYLPSYLRPCFAYCSIFPKDHAFKKEQLILLWMAEGFLHATENRTMEQIGDDYFGTLLSRSFFQRSNEDESRFVMHDLINDLANFVSGEFTCRLEVDHDRSHKISDKTRHFSYVRSQFETYSRFEALNEFKLLRTYIALESSRMFIPHYLSKKVPRDLLPMLRTLRVLSLSHYRYMTELPASIGKLKHLRYLDVSDTRLTRLPDCLCKLCNLQTLNLSGCINLIALPRDMEKLIALRHLDISGTVIKEMPENLGKLKCLQTLTKFIISQRSGCCIGELGNLANLWGTLSILELQNVKSPIVALAANLRDKKNLEELTLEWNATAKTSGSEGTILESLQPHTNLKSLTIQHYRGENFPNWIANQSFSKITSLHLKNCEYCRSLPPVWQIPSLQTLSIIGFDRIITVGPEFYGTGSSSPFEALKVLRFENMLNWEKWCPFRVENEGAAFPHLGELCIINCPKLTGSLPVHLPSLAKIVISECHQLVAERLLSSNSCLQELEICDCSSLLSLPTGGLPSTLKQLVLRNCWKFEVAAHIDHSFLEELCLYCCDSLEYFPLDVIPNVKRIRIKECRNFKSLAVLEQSEHDLVALSSIEIVDCPKFGSFPEGGLRGPNLTSCLLVGGCLRSLPEKMHTLLSSLTVLVISNCQEIESFPEGGLPSNLETLHIRNCEKLAANRMGWGLQNCSSLAFFVFESKSENVVSFPEASLLPASLTNLHIIGFPNLKSLDKNGIQYLTSLKFLRISDCPKLKSMSEEGLPPSISFLLIRNCPLLNKQWQKRKGKEWRKIAHVPYKLLDLDIMD